MVPAIQGVAPVAHVALVLRGIGLEVTRRSGRAHLGAVHPQRGLLKPGTVRPGPVGERYLGVNQLLNLVLGVVAAAVVIVVLVFVVVIVPAPPIPVVVVVVLEGAVRRLDVGQREDDLAVRPVRCFAQQGHATGVGAL